MSSGPVELVVNGYLLQGLSRNLGCSRTVRQLIASWVRLRGAQSLRVLVAAGGPDPRLPGAEASLVPVSGSSPFPESKPLPREYWWDNRMAGAARRLFPEALFLQGNCSPILRWPRRNAVYFQDCFYRHQWADLSWRERLLWRWTEARCARAGRILAISEFTRSELLRYAGQPADRVRVVQCWLSSEFSGPVEREPTAGGPWLYVGGYHVRKEVPVLIRAYRAAAARCAVPPLILCGEAAAARRVVEAAGGVPRAGERFVFPGFVTEGQLRELYRQAAVLVYPSRYEGFGYPLLEAAQLGTPILCRDHPVFREVLGRAGPLPETAGEAEFAQALVSLARGEPVAVTVDPVRFPKEEAHLQGFEAAVGIAMPG